MEVTIKELIKDQNSSYYLNEVAKRIDEAVLIKDLYSLDLISAQNLFNCCGIVSYDTAKKALNGYREKYGASAISLICSINCGKIGFDSCDILSEWTDSPLLTELIKTIKEQRIEINRLKKEIEDFDSGDDLCIETNSSLEIAQREIFNLKEEIRKLNLKIEFLEKSLEEKNCSLETLKKKKIHSNDIIKTFLSLSIGVEINCSSRLDGFLGGPQALKISNGRGFLSEDKPKQYVEYEFDIPISITKYKITSNTIRSWKLLGLNGYEWYTIDNRHADTNDECCEVKLSNHTRPFKKIRLIQTGCNRDGGNKLFLQYLKFEGDFDL